VWFRYYQDKVPHTTREVGSFWWKDVMRLNNIYRSVSQCFIGNGSTVCFWEDRWLPDVLSTKYPRLASFARNRYASVQEIMTSIDLDNLFILPLTQQAFEEMLQLQEGIQNVSIEEDDKDTWCPSWGSFFTSKKFYSLVYNMLTPFTR